MLTHISLFTGNANPRLAEAICLELGIPLGKAEVFQFSNENIFVKLIDSVRERDVYVVQSFSSPVNVSIMELLIMIDALKRASAARITAVIPYYAYGRTDKKDQPRVPITARLLADLLTVAGAQRVLAMNLHAGQIQGFFNIPVDEISALRPLSRYFVDKKLSDWVVVAPDLGAAKKARNFAERIGANLAVIEKRRFANEGSSEILNVIGEVANRRAIIFDDEVDTAGSIVGAAKVLQEQGTAEIYAACTHGVLSGPAIDRL
ncbi:MAG TPA: ribose-phosphate diphosphokinase, partial [Chloroflexota bacterium]|nr:ribose-phosphate diphosphokinase [Chloroflexota bacterium]